MDLWQGELIKVAVDMEVSVLAKLSSSGNSSPRQSPEDRQVRHSTLEFRSQPTCSYPTPCPHAMERVSNILVGSIVGGTFDEDQHCCGQSSYGIGSSHQSS